MKLLCKIFGHKDHTTTLAGPAHKACAVDIVKTCMRCERTTHTDGYLHKYAPTCIVNDRLVRECKICSHRIEWKFQETYLPNLLSPIQTVCLGKLYWHWAGLDGFVTESTPIYVDSTGLFWASEGSRRYHSYTTPAALIKNYQYMPDLVKMLRGYGIVEKIEVRK